MTGWHLDDDTLRCYVERTDSLAEGTSVEQRCRVGFHRPITIPASHHVTGQVCG
jgi:hypothetical protein